MPFFDIIIEYSFMRQALIAAIVIGIIAPVLGVFIVVRRMAMIADALSHITLSGIACSLLLGRYFLIFQLIHPVYMGIVFSVLSSFGIEALRTKFRHYQEIAIPIIMAAGLGSGVIFISLANGFNQDLFTYLFGSIVAISFADMWVIIGIGMCVLLFVFVFYKELFAISHDAEHARLTGVSRLFIHFLFIIIVALVIAATMRIVGILLVSALMILPVAAALKIANSFKQTFLYAIVFSQLAVMIGFYLSYEFALASGGTIVVTAFTLLMIVIAGKALVERYQRIRPGRLRKREGSV